VSRYLIDTNILSEPLKPQPNPSAIERLRQYTDEIAIASVTWHEIRYGCLRLPASRKRSQIEQYLQKVPSTFPILPYDVATAEWHATERTRLTALGRSPAYADGQIAAIAHINGLILVTHNVSDFAGFQDLQIEDWLS
jgi:tRNA(fMet)-specific endonuclease VapC